MNKELLLSARESGTGFWLDPRTKLLFLLSINGVLIGDVRMWVLCALTLWAGILLVLFRRIKSAVRFVVVFFVMWAGEVFLLPFAQHNKAVMFIVLISTVLRRFIPCFMVGSMFISTTTISELIASMERMYISEKIIIPFAVILRFFPTVQEEWHSIKEAMKMRGIGLNFVSVLTAPLKMLEYILIPLLTSTVKIGEELSASALSRGLGSDVKRTNTCQIGFGLCDAVVILMSVLFFILIMK